eukprot:CAMPEP_0174694816 /NCGR_PEP_ID=MMETSP1094-20130205/1326_1 /TAXON_ID=156173 /ORGANISM="Chrysochromulina brevifilum, Strain UTEX LB 985" /LENGTH=159 /DNA_ID=CAMNT_0015891155 /DNA_START=20 /DNA_END=499 /DNA_ORIENTATION=-
MLSLVVSGLALNVGSTVQMSPRAHVTMGAMLEGNFIYGTPVPASKGLPGFSSPASFTADLTGKVVLTALSRPTSSKAVSYLQGEFVYGSPVPASTGLSGFSSPTSFVADATDEMETTASSRPASRKVVSYLEGQFVYGAPLPVSKGLPGFSNPTSFPTG